MRAVNEYANNRKTPRVVNGGYLLKNEKMFFDMVKTSNFSILCENEIPLDNYHNISRGAFSGRDYAMPDSPFERKVLKINKNYDFKDKTKVMRFLGKHNFLVDVLEEAITYIDDCFEYHYKYLEVISFSGDESGDMLFANIVTSNKAERAHNQLNEFREIWFSEKAKETLGKINFDVEFVEGN